MLNEHFEPQIDRKVYENQLKIVMTEAQTDRQTDIH